MRNRYLFITVVVALWLGVASPATAQTATPPPRQSAASWVKIHTTDNELQALVPVEPRLHLYRNFIYREHGAWIKERRTALADGEGAAFVVQMHDTDDPAKLFKDYLSTLRGPAPQLKDVSLGGFTGKESVTRLDNLYTVTHYFTTRTRLYIIIAAARDEANPAIAHFLSSITLGASNAPSSPATASPSPSPSPAHANAVAPEEVQNAKMVTKKATLLWKPEPGFSEEARQQNITGTVKLRMVLTSSGTVTNVEVVRSLSAGLTERAVYAAQHIGFLPAEKDGRPVSQWVMVEYNFNIY